MYFKKYVMKYVNNLPPRCDVHDKHVMVDFILKSFIFCSDIAVSANTTIICHIKNTLMYSWSYTCPTNIGGYHKGPIIL